MMSCTCVKQRSACLLVLSSSRLGSQGRHADLCLLRSKESTQLARAVTLASSPAPTAVGEQ